MFRSALVAIGIGLAAAPATAGAASITTGDATANGSSGTSARLRATFEAPGCAGAVSYQIGTVPLDQGGFRVIASSASTPTSLPGRTSDVTTITGLVPDTLYYYRALLSTHNCASAGESATGAQRCMLKGRSVYDPENTSCPGESSGGSTGGGSTGGGSTGGGSTGGGSTGGGSTTDKCAKAGSCSSNRIKLPGKYCPAVYNGSGQTYMFVLKVQGFSCKTAEALVDRQYRRSGKFKRYTMSPSKAVCTAKRSTGTGMEYECKLGRQRIWYFGYGNLKLSSQIWTNLYPRGS